MCDGSGTIVSRINYDPYGKPTILFGTKPLTKQYAGLYAHQTSGLGLAEYRAYDPSTGRWLSRDPLGEGWNATLYSYVWNDPIDLVDPMGLYGENAPPLTAAPPSAGQQGANDAAAAMDTQSQVAGTAIAPVINVGLDIAMMLNMENGLGKAGALAKFSSEKQALVAMAKCDKKTG